MPTKTKKTQDQFASVATVSDTCETRQLFRQSIVNAEVERDIRPLDFDVLRDCVVDRDKDDLEHYLKTGEEGVVRVKITEPFVRGCIMANGANRDRTASHCEGLATDFRGTPALAEDGSETGELEEGTGFRSAMTHIVISAGGMMEDGGHSTYALGMAFFPLSIFDDIYTKTVVTKDAEGNEVETVKTEYPNVSKDFRLCAKVDEDGNYVLDENGQYIPDEEIAEYYRNRYSESEFVVNVVVNAPGDICRKLAERRLQIGVKEYLLMVPQLKHWMQSTPLDADTWEQVVKGWKLRTDCKENKDGTIVYGSMKKGGRPNNAESPAWLLAFAPQAHDALAILQGDRETIHYAVSLSKKDVLIAMCCLDVAGMKRLATALQSEKSAYAKALDPFITPNKADPTWRKAPTWWLVASMIAYGRGKSADEATALPITIDKDSDQIDPQQDETLRAPGWDSYEYDCLVEDEDEVLEGEDRDQTILECGTVVGDIIGNTEELAASLQMKKTRKGKGTRGRNKK